MTQGKQLAAWRHTGWRAALAGLLALAVAMPAFALGLGQIQVRSQAGQPLLAEIPIVTSDPSELDNLQARLASPDTFRRIGLQPPQGIVSDLQFTVALDARGNPVIRVTSPVPVRQSLLTFLVEVDWGQGRLVREYSALLDAPQTVSAPAQPPIQAPVAPPSNTIVRPAEAAQDPVAGVEPDAEASPEATSPAETPAAEPAADPDGIAVVPTPVAPPPAPAPAPAPPVAPSATAAPPSEYGPVQAGDTLGAIAEGLRPEGYTLDQTMLALLRANPDAFINDNVNLVRQGAVLRMPDGDALSQYGAAEATAVVREQISQWREMRRPVPQPEAVAGEGTADAGNASGAAGGAPRVADARLEITPPSQGAGQRAGTRSGIAAGGEGDMLRQEMQQTQETLAARNAEVEELKARVAELEQLQQQQQQLISLKDSELAAAQQRLAESNQRPATTLAQANAGDPASTAASAAGGGLPWLWVGLALLVAGLLAWLFTRRKRSPAPGRTFDTSALAAGMPRALEEVREDVTEAEHEDAAEAAIEDDAPVRTEGEDLRGRADARHGAVSWNTPPAGSVEMAAPTWHSGTRPAPVEDASTVVSLNPSPAGQERIELARAYIDLGDVDTARSLLREVAEGGDAESRDEAARVLRSLA
jgi:pilus assembly protein FimV